MSEQIVTQYESFSEKETFQVAKTLSENARAGEVYCLSGDLGVGKTVFTKFKSVYTVSYRVLSCGFRKFLPTGRTPVFA